MTEKISTGIKGGARAGAGRKKGKPNKKTAEMAAKVAAEGITPLEFMLNIMRGTACPKDATAGQILAFHSLRFEAAKAAAPYVHAKLTSVEVAGKGGGPIQTENVTRIELVPLDDSPN